MVRQVERLVLRYRAAGVAGLVSGRRGRPSHLTLQDLLVKGLAKERSRDKKNSLSSTIV
ncbi:hypothetical protein [Trinickia violacea]|nr:hypothetical protein [Trinickia violacea]